MKSSTLVPIKETLFIAIGEALCSLAVCGVFLLIGKYDTSVLLGSVLGSLVIIVNFLIMSIAVNRAIDQAFLLRGNYVDEPAAESVADSEASVADAACIDTDGESDTPDDSDEPDAVPAVQDAVARFAAEQSLRVSRISKISFIVRTVSILATLVIALITKVFNPIATVIPMLAMRPIIMVEGLLRGKKQ